MLDITLLIIMIGTAWFWWNAMQSKELACQAGKSACERAGVQFLDDTVERKKLWLRRNSNGRIELCRLYFFEFSSDGAHRYLGRVVILGTHVSEVEMDAYRI